MKKTLMALAILTLSTHIDAFYYNFKNQTNKYIATEVTLHDSRGDKQKHTFTLEPVGRINAQLILDVGSNEAIHIIAGDDKQSTSATEKIMWNRTATIDDATGTLQITLSQ